MSNPSAARPAAPELWAEVHAHDRVVRYRRRGAGPPVLVLGSPASTRGSGASLWPELLEALAAGHRVLLPELPAAAGSGEWLADFLEGLGLARVTVVAAGPSCGAALELAFLAPDQVARVVLVGDGEANASGLQSPSSGAAVHAGPVPLLVIRSDLPCAEALPLVARFVDGEDAAVSS